MFKIKGTRKLAHFMIFSLVLLLVLFSLVIVGTGYSLFTRYYSREYSESAYRVGLTAEALIKTDHLDEYLASNGENEEYKITNNRLGILTNNMDVSIIYVIKLDDDYKNYTSIFNVVNNNSGYSPWEIGSRHKTTNEIYEKKYKEIMDGKIEKATIFRTRDLNGAKPHLTSLMPLKNSNGDIVAILCVQRFMGNLKNARRRYVLSIFIFTIISIIISIIITKLFIGNQVVKPVIQINKEAKRFANDEEKTVGDFEKVSIISEIESLSRSINKMEKDTVKYIDTITDATKEKEKISTELKLASAIQENSLPNDFPAFPEREDFDLYALMRPAKEVGGDFYDFFLIDDNHIGLVMADVSGKGVPAALFMMVTKILINEISHSVKNPGEILTLVNERICNNNKANMFITVWLGILDLRTGEMVAANAGHEDPAICKKDGEFIINKQKHGIPVGAMEEYKYKDYDIKLESGDKLFIYTDGVPEAENNNDKMFGLEKMIESLNRVKNNSCEDILVSVKNDVDTFVDGAIRFDDLTMLCFEYIGKDNSIRKKETFKADTEELERVLSFIHGVVNKRVENKITMKLDVVVEEIFVNICHYAYEDSGFADIEVSLNKNKLSITFMDEGVPFDPLKKDEPDISLPSDDREIGGLGIFMVKKMMDKVSYKYENNKNILTIEKKLGGK